MGQGTRKRKVRSDKKHDVKPTIPIELKENIYRMAELCGMYVKDLGETLCLEGNASNEVMQQLSPHFKKNVRLGNIMYFGQRENAPYPRSGGHHERITIKFQNLDYDNITLLAYTMGVTPSRATALLLDLSMRNPIIFDTLIQKNINARKMDDQDKAELKRLVKFVQTNNPYKESISWGRIAKHVAVEVGDFVINGWRKE